MRPKQRPRRHGRTAGRGGTGILPSRGQVLVEISHSGVCGTRLMEARGKKGRTDGCPIAWGMRQPVSSSKPGLASQR